MPTDELVLVDGSTFYTSSLDGDVRVQRHGLFHADIRHLSQWELRLDGQPLRQLTTRRLTYYRGYIAATLARGIGDNPTLLVHRTRVLGGGCAETIELESHSDADADVVVELSFACDFASIFAVKAGRGADGGAECDLEARTATVRSTELPRATVLVFDGDVALDVGTARWQLHLAPRSHRVLTVETSYVVDDAAIEPRHDRRTGVVHPQMPMSLEDWNDRAPRLTCESSSLCATYEQSLLDLASLRFRPTRDLDHSLPAAGQPWFMALFGRDSIIAAFEALPFHASLAAATLRVLAGRQSQVDDPARDAEPGKILHEVRSVGAQRGAGTGLDVPAYPYFGAHDATPLFLILLDEYHRWTGDDELVAELEGAARAALTWIERYGDPDRDGYLEYRRRAPHGLENQCWKDSWNSMRLADGRFARPPIATCEIQGYAFDARRRTARLARECCGDPSLAQHLELDAKELYDRFNRDFFDDGRGRYVLALDGDKQQVDALTSNVGHPALERNRSRRTLQARRGAAGGRPVVHRLGCPHDG